MAFTSHSTQFTLFKDLLARRFLSLPILKRDKDFAGSGENDLDDFTTYLATTMFPSLPATLQTLESTYSGPDINLDAAVNTTPTEVVDTLTSYSFFSDEDDVHKFLRSVLEEYVTDTTSPPVPVNWKATRKDVEGCEICGREDLPLTYHHLIPKAAHAKVLKRKWHDESMLNSVAWLCRPCHSAVHSVARTEELAKSYYTVELLMSRDDIQRWAAYASKQRASSRKR